MTRKIKVKAQGMTGALVAPAIEEKRKQGKNRIFESYVFIYILVRQ